jgi:PAS domain S-box-containing protein
MCSIGPEGRYPSPAMNTRHLIGFHLRDTMLMTLPERPLPLKYSKGRSSLEAHVLSEPTGLERTAWEATALLALALVVALAFWLGRRSVGNAIAWREVGRTPSAEVNTLMAELRETIKGLREQAEQAILARKDRLELALDAAKIGSWHYNPRSGVLSWDTRCQGIFDAVRNEMTIEEWMTWVHPEDAERVRANGEAALDPVNPKRTVTEYRVLQRGGGFRWVASVGIAYFECVGSQARAAGMVGTVQDITERKEREEKEHLLMREINHRAKNMLSVVHSIAQQTATQNAEDFVERLSERIQALSANQDLLVRNAWNGVEIKDLTRAQLARFADLIGSRIDVHGPELRLKAASAQAIGLALHELATNAGKYGALSTDKGRIDIDWGDRGRDAHDELDGARWPARVPTAAARVRHYRYGTDDGAQYRRCG